MSSVFGDDLPGKKIMIFSFSLSLSPLPLSFLVVNADGKKEGRRFFTLSISAQTGVRAYENSTCVQIEYFVGYCRQSLTGNVKPSSSFEVLFIGKHYISYEFGPGLVLHSVD